MKSDRLVELLKFLEKAPQDSFTLYSIAYEYLNRNQLNEALIYFQKVREGDPEYTGNYYHLGKTLELMNKQDEAINVYKEGIEITRKLRDTHALSELMSALNKALGIDYEDEV